MTTWTVQRGVDGTTPVSSAATGTAVTSDLYAEILLKVSETYSAPTITNGQVIDWQPDSIDVEEWGRFKIVIDGVDFTYFRGVPTVVEELVSEEPGGDASASIYLPQVDMRENLGSLGISDWALIEVWKVAAAGGAESLLWDGFVVAPETRRPGVALQCVGALFALDVRLEPPSLIVIAGGGDVGHTAFNTVFACPETGVSPPPLVTTGVRTHKIGSSFQPRLQFLFDLFSIATVGTDQWTIANVRPKQSRVYLKDRTTVHWTVQYDQRGMDFDLKRQLDTGVNQFYGEGIDTGNCRWRGSVYPNVHPDAAPVWPGNTFSTGGYNTGTDVQTWKQRMHDTGWGVNWAVGQYNIYSAQDAAAATEFQRQAGLTTDGMVGAQTWNSSFGVGPGSTTPGSAFEVPHIRPIYWLAHTTQFLYDAYGNVVGDNPDYDPTIPVIDRYVNYGPKVSKGEATLAAADEMFRDNVCSWVGTIVFHADPNEGSRWEMDYGQNIKVENLPGDGLTSNPVMHIHRITKNPIDGTVTCEVDAKARDLLNVSAQLSRQRDASGPGRRVQPTRRNSHQIEDEYPEWDCEAGGGIIPRMGQTGGLWNVIKVPFFEYGSVVRFDIAAETPCEIAAAVFSLGWVTPNYLASKGDPRLTVGYWDSFPESDGLVVAWGETDQMGGYWPGRKSDSDPVTGRLVDNQSFFIESFEPPWAYVAVLTSVTTYVSGRFSAGTAGMG